MTSTLAPPLPAQAESLPSLAWWSFRNTLVLARRGVARIIREPSQLLDVTVQPLIFVLLFVYVFGSAIKVPGGGNYHEYLIGGMFGMALVGTAQGTAVGVSTDMATGLTDRFRSLPIARSAVLAGRVIADLLTEVIALAVLVITGLAVGWRIHNGAGDAVAAFGLCLLIAFAMTWAGACAGHAGEEPGSRGGHRVHILPPPGIRLQHLRPHPGHARLAPGRSGLEPGQRRRLVLPEPLRQPEPVLDHPGLADAAPRTGHRPVVDRTDRRVRPPRRPLLPAQVPAIEANGNLPAQVGRGRVVAATEMVRTRLARTLILIDRSASMFTQVDRGSTVTVAGQALDRTAPCLPMLPTTPELGAEASR